jgi:2',3'-cyclic-nucleotide 2'-phosphodiesterase (5'-nucleotidase family)
VKESLFYILLSVFPIFFSLQVSAEQITIAYTANTSGKLTECGCPSDPYGGLAERVTLINKLRAKEKSFLLIDAGNMVNLFGDYEERSAIVARLMDMMGYNASCIGNQEMFNGTASAVKLIRAAKFPVLSSTIAWKNNLKPIFQQYSIVKYGGLNVGIIAVCDSNCINRESKSPIDYTILPIESTLKSIMTELAPKADFIISLSQMNTDSNKKLLKTFPQIDLVIEGYGNVRIEQPLPSSQGFIVSPGDRGQFVGLITLEKTNNGRLVVKKSEMNPVLEIEPDPKAMEIVKNYYRTRK